MSFSLKSKNFRPLKLSKENEDVSEGIEVENSNLKRINGLLKDENEKLKEWIEDMKKSDDTRRAGITEMEGGKLSALQRDSKS